MPTSHEAQLTNLRKQLTGLQSDIGKFAKRKEIQNIIDLIKIKRGWTTPAEFAFATTIVSALQAQITQLNTIVSSFEAAARQVKELG